MPSLNIGVLVSGNGTNLQALIDAVEKGKIKGTVSVVLSSREDAYALKRARNHGIEAVFLDPEKYPDRDTYCKALARELKRRQVGLVCLAGFMYILSPYFISQFKYRIINIHPALLPSFGGKGMYGYHVHEAVINSGESVSGCTVHFVDEGCDTGPIILQSMVSVLSDDTPEKLAQRVLTEEHRIYPEVVRLFSEGKIIIENSTVKIKD